ncbi:type 1 glutamine amidotransferase domain-containing protein [Steroidobacter flavus]|uniref:Type 1 glutamine amidotransferase domain-containing protein n=1 Tax=Steroidobacter flavus TaxID=1842136 RepID=A0ABV8T5J5_9GAMM
MSKHILMVVTSNDRLGDHGGATGTWLEELAGAYYTFIDAGHTVSIASTRGGSAPLDPGSLQEPWLTETGRRFQHDARATAALRDTLPIEGLKASTFDAIYLVGGAGTAWDFPASTPLTRLIEALDRSGRVVAAVCHGVLGLTTARCNHDKPLVAGRAVTGVSNAEERAIGYDKIVPLLPEERMNQLGAQYSCAAEPFQSHVVRDGNLLTGQNPASAAPLAVEVLRALA